MLNVIHHIPDGLLTTPPTELYEIFSEPTLMHLSGVRDTPLFISVLLHGNETTGYFAIQELLKKYQGISLPRSLSIFFGNVQAARYALRRLDNQVDYNRVWPHQGFSSDSKESLIMSQVIDEMKTRQVFVSVDIHNNTGLNPHYACVNRMDNAFFQLAILFSRTVIYFIRPQGVLSQAFAEICPSITIECGKTEHRHGITHALELIESCLNISSLPTNPVLKQDIDLFHTVATVSIKPDIDFSFTDSQSSVCFRSDLEKLNFCELPIGTGIGEISDPELVPFLVINEDGKEVYDQFFRVDNHRLVTNCDIMPSMLTTEIDIIRKDCLCYLMERINID
jgi:succinylglutamate desuccinylase